MYFDMERLPLLIGETPSLAREYLFVDIDDFFRELYAAILSDKIQYSAATFLKQVLGECPYTMRPHIQTTGLSIVEIRVMRSDGSARNSALSSDSRRYVRPRMNGKAERVIKTLMDLWYEKTVFKSRVHRKQEFIRFMNWYNTVKPHASLNNWTPLEFLITYFYRTEL